METKTCTLCKQQKSSDLFIKNRKKQPGSWCRDCANRYRRDKGYNAYSNRDKYLATFQKELRKTPENKAYEKNFRQHYKQTLSGTASTLLSGVKSRAKAKGLESDLDLAWVEERLGPLKCEATGVDLVLEVDNGVCHSAFRPSIDRIDNGKGYTKDNCRVVSVIFNKAKSDYNDADVLKMARGLLQRNVE